MQQVRYFAREIYGRRRLYVADPAQRAAIETLTRRRTVEASDMKALETLGVEFTQIIPPVKK